MLRRPTEWDGREREMSTGTRLPKYRKPTADGGLDARRKAAVMRLLSGNGPLDTRNIWEEATRVLALLICWDRDEARHAGRCC